MTENQGDTIQNVASFNSSTEQRDDSKINFDSKQSPHDNILMGMITIKSQPAKKRIQTQIEKL